MCTSHTPKVEQPTEKKPVYMSNPYLDGLGIGAEASGRNSLRIDIGSPLPSRNPVAPPPVYVAPGGGGLGIGGASFGGGNGGMGIGTRNYVR
jgi:hypothetical protein